MFFFKLLLQSIWVSSRGSQKELDEAKMRFAAAEVSSQLMFDFFFRAGLAAVRI